MASACIEADRADESIETNAAGFRDGGSMQRAAESEGLLSLSLDIMA